MMTRMMTRMMTMMKIMIVWQNIVQTCPTYLQSTEKVKTSKILHKLKARTSFTLSSNFDELGGVDHSSLAKPFARRPPQLYLDMTRQKVKMT